MGTDPIIRNIRNSQTALILFAPRLTVADGRKRGGGQVYFIVSDEQCVDVIGIANARLELSKLNSSCIAGL